MRIVFNTRDDFGVDIKDAPELQAETMARLRGPNPPKFEFKSNVGQTITVHQVSDDRRTVKLEIKTHYGSSRREKWDMSKLEGWLEEGFFVRSDGPAFALWQRDRGRFHSHEGLINERGAELFEAAVGLAKRLHASGNDADARLVIDLVEASGQVGGWELASFRSRAIGEEG